jgi:hypothetical protein
MSNFVNGCKRADLEQVLVVRARLVYVIVKLELDTSLKFVCELDSLKKIYGPSSSSVILVDPELEYLARAQPVSYNSNYLF